jgi:hypothetical protein
VIGRYSPICPDLLVDLTTVNGMIVSENEYDQFNECMVVDDQTVIRDVVGVALVCGVGMLSSRSKLFRP